MAAITLARCTNLSGSLRDFANRQISASSSVVNVRNAIRFGISFPPDPLEDYSKRI